MGRQRTGVAGRFAALLDRFRPPPVDIAWITPTLALGAGPDARRHRDLERAGVTAILDLREDFERGAGHDLPGVDDGALKIYRIRIVDTTAPTQAQLHEGAEWVLAELGRDGKVLVCCRVGAQRSATMVTAVLVRLGYGVREAFTLVNAKRRIANPNRAQVRALREFSESFKSR
jgi:rhodanese-related sulfurtransferase